AIVQAGIRAAAAGSLTTRALNDLTTWTRGTHVSVIAVGKASAAMARAAVDALGRSLRTGVGIGPTGPIIDPRLRSIAGEHPQPGPGSLAAGQHALEIARDVAVDERLLVLLSGGASSLMAVPAPGITLDEKRQATGILLKSGADIYALN